MNHSVRRILLPTDFSPASRRAREHACGLAGLLASELHVIHVLPEVLPPPGPPDSWFAPTETPPLQIIQQVHAQLESEMKDSGIMQSSIVRSVLFGNAVQQILSYAKRHGIDLIVLGTHGRTGVSHALLGSVAEKVVRLAKCPVLTVHGDESESEAETRLIGADLAQLA